MMRIIENGMKVKMIYTEQESYAVDTQEDLDNVIKRMKTDILMKKYIE
jgi:CMP-2-keto-3-deoxyoctulosonic acid synthetase